MSFLRYASIAVSVASLLASSACRTDSQKSGVQDLPGTTVGNGDGPAKAIEIQYANPGTGVDSDTMAKIEAKIAAAAKDGKVAKRTTRAGQLEGERNDCVEFVDWHVMQVYRRDICALIKAGNEAAGAQVTTHKIVGICNDDSLAPFAGNDQGCN